MELSFIYIFSVLLLYSNIWFNFNLIESKDWHLPQSIQYGITCLGIGVALYLSPILTLIDVILLATCIVSYRFMFFDIVLNLWRGKKWNYKLWGNMTLKIVVFIVCNILLISVTLFNK